MRTAFTSFAGLAELPYFELDGRGRLCLADDSVGPIADVHTQPTDEFGDMVGKVLHVATGSARPIVVTVETCGEPRAYVGLVSSYYQLVTSDFERRNDAMWNQQLMAGDAPDAPAWLADLLAPPPPP